VVHDIKGDILTVLEDLVHIDSIILDLEDRNYVLCVNAYEALKEKCSQNWEAFNYLQERVHDARIPERAQSEMHEIVSLIRMQTYVKQVLHVW
jgi:hypothetical protein